jgi:hypothetical protein
LHSFGVSRAALLWGRDPSCLGPHIQIAPQGDVAPSRLKSNVRSRFVSRCGPNAGAAKARPSWRAEGLERFSFVPAFDSNRAEPWPGLAALAWPHTR